MTYNEEAAARKAVMIAERDVKYPRQRMPRAFLEERAARGDDFGHVHYSWPASCWCSNWSRDIADEALSLMAERDAARAELAAAKARVFAIVDAAEADARAAVVRSERRLRV